MFKTKPVLFLISLLAIVSLHQCSVFDAVSGSASNSLSRLGFSLSDSTSALVTSLSKSTSGISKSSSEDDEDKKKTSEYKSDVRTVLSLYYQHPSTQADLEADLALVAKEYGLSNWKSHPATYIAIGQGMKQA